MLTSTRPDADRIFTAFHGGMLVVVWAVLSLVLSPALLSAHHAVAHAETSTCQHTNHECGTRNDADDPHPVETCGFCAALAASTACPVPAPPAVPGLTGPQVLLPAPDVAVLLVRVSDAHQARGPPA